MEKEQDCRIKKLLPFVVVVSFSKILRYFTKKARREVDADDVDYRLQRQRTKTMETLVFPEGEVELSTEDRTLNTQNEQRYQQEIIKRKRLEKERRNIEGEILRKLVPRMKVKIATKEIEQQDCFLCELPIYEKQEYFQCFTCGAYFHKEHLLDLLKTNDCCPLCKQDFTIDIVKES